MNVSPVKSSIKNQIIWVTLFSIAMGYLETAVVVYLRILYYPDGFDFPLVALAPNVGIVEVFREAATIIMLLGVGILAGHNARQRLAYFLISFAVWDVFYYVFLKLTLDWPASVFTWDILFLIPAPWVGPVLTPVIICFIMIALASVILRNDARGKTQHLHGKHWSLLIMGSLIVIYSWMLDYITFSGKITDSPENAMKALSTYIPTDFNWWIFIAGVLVLITGVGWFYRDSQK